MEEQNRIAWIGLGRMGLPMAKNLLPIATPLKFFNRTTNRGETLSAAGAIRSQSPSAAAENSDLVFTMVADDEALERVTLGRDGVLDLMAPGSILIDMSTVSPAVSKTVGAAAKKKEIDYLCAPVSGSTAMAEAGKLTILVSGPPNAIKRCDALFARMSAKQFAVGHSHEARALKLSLNLMIGTSAAMLAEALALSEKAGVDWNMMLDVITSSAVSSPFIQYKASQLRNRDFSPMFKAHQMAKDFSLLLAESNNLSVPTPVAAQVSSYWSEMINRGLGEEDFIACLKIVEQDAKLTDT